MKNSMSESKKLFLRNISSIVSIYQHKHNLPNILKRMNKLPQKKYQIIHDFTKKINIDNPTKYKKKKRRNIMSKYIYENLNTYVSSLLQEQCIWFQNGRCKNNQSIYQKCPGVDKCEYAKIKTDIKKELEEL